MFHIFIQDSELWENLQGSVQHPRAVQSWQGRSESQPVLKGRGSRRWGKHKLCTALWHCFPLTTHWLIYATTYLKSVKYICFYPQWISLWIVYCKHCEAMEKIAIVFCHIPNPCCCDPRCEILVISFTTVKIKHIFGGTCINIYVCIQLYLED